MRTLPSDRDFPMREVLLSPEDDGEDFVDGSSSRRSETLRLYDYTVSRVRKCPFTLH
jgi:hypothetical protein